MYKDSIIIIITINVVNRFNNFQIGDLQLLLEIMDLEIMEYNNLPNYISANYFK